jgi:hypothetical protein
MAEAAKVVPWITAQCAGEALSTAGIGATIWGVVDTGEATAEEAPLLVRSLLSAGLTTIGAIGNAIYAFAMNPEQWDSLRANPSLVRSAFDEVVVWESPVQMFFRTPTRAAEFRGRCGASRRKIAAVASVRQSRSAQMGRSGPVRHQPTFCRSCRFRCRNSSLCRSNACATRV